MRTHMAVAFASTGGSYVPCASQATPFSLVFVIGGAASVLMRCVVSSGVAGAECVAHSAARGPHHDLFLREYRVSDDEEAPPVFHRRAAYSLLEVRVAREAVISHTSVVVDSHARNPFSVGCQGAERAVAGD